MVMTAKAVICAGLLVVGASGVKWSFFHHSKKDLVAPKARKGDKCKCLNWKQAYESEQARCGTTNEFYLVDQKHTRSQDEANSLYPAVGGEFCDRFFKVVDDNYCINVNMGADAGQWCYVDAACESLNGGAKAQDGSKASVKICDPAAGFLEKLTRAYSPPGLESVAEDSKLDLGLLHKMSYPLEKEFLFKDVSAYFGVGPEAIVAVPKGIQADLNGFRQYVTARFGNFSAGRGHLDAGRVAKLDEIVASGVPHSFDMDGDNHPPHIIVEGHKLYMVLGELITLKGL